MVPFRYKVAVAVPLGPPTLPPPPRPVSKFREDVRLGGDEALEIDCDEINRIIAEIPPEGQFFPKGFVVIESDVELDVVAVYTVSGRSGQVSIHMERVPARRPIRSLQQG